MPDAKEAYVEILDDILLTKDAAAEIYDLLCSPAWDRLAAALASKAQSEMESGWYNYASTMPEIDRARGRTSRLQEIANLRHTLKDAIMHPIEKPE